MILHYPCDKRTICQSFWKDNTRIDKRKGFYELFDNRHPGVDFCVPEGTDIYSCFDGIVVRNEFHNGMGNVIGTRFGNIVVLYAHLSKSLVKLGQVIKAEQRIAISGNTGLATTKPHLHLELRDITKSTLKEMVFDPPFEKELISLRHKFEYKVNNQNTPKTPDSLAERYFGDKKYWEKIRDINPHLDPNPKLEIPNQTVITIPNY